MSFKQVELPEGQAAHRIHHGMDTTALLINAWQNNTLVTPSVRVVDENSIEVYNMSGGGTLVIAAADPESKTSGSTSGEEDSSDAG